MVESPCSLLCPAADDMIKDVANRAEVDNTVDDPTHQGLPDKGQVYFVDAREEGENLVPNEEEAVEDAAGQIDSKEEMQHSLGAHLQRIVAKREANRADVNALKKSKVILSMLKKKTKERKFNLVPKLDAEASLLQLGREESAMVQNPMVEDVANHTAVASMADDDPTHHGIPGEEQVHFVDAQEAENLVPNEEEEAADQIDSNDEMQQHYLGAHLQDTMAERERELNRAEFVAAQSAVEGGPE